MRAISTTGLNKVVNGVLGELRDSFRDHGLTIRFWNNLGEELADPRTHHLAGVGCHEPSEGEILDLASCAIGTELRMHSTESKF